MAYFTIKSILNAKKHLQPCGTGFAATHALRAATVAREQ